VGSDGHGRPNRRRPGSCWIGFFGCCGLGQVTSDGRRRRRGFEVIDGEEPALDEGLAKRFWALITASWFRSSSIAAPRQGSTVCRRPKVGRTINARRGFPSVSVLSASCSVIRACSLQLLAKLAGGQKRKEDTPFRPRPGAEVVGPRGRGFSSLVVVGMLMPFIGFGVHRGPG